ncbi:MAG: DNA cytosine methyltransferase, partial [Paludibacteraceae bacterium]|nr:DNA cytosine methyltransferase [Paludibacteraceae bacterium]
MLRVFTAFSGYDSQCMALDRLGIDYELVGWSEIDKYAIMAHNAVYPQWAERNFGDISKIDWSQVADFDLFTYSSPCQDFSQGGKQQG